MCMHSHDDSQSSSSSGSDDDQRDDYRKPINYESSRRKHDDPVVDDMLGKRYHDDSSERRYKENRNRGVDGRRDRDEVRKGGGGVEDRKYDNSGKGDGRRGDSGGDGRSRVEDRRRDDRDGYSIGDSRDRNDRRRDDNDKNHGGDYIRSDIDKHSEYRHDDEYRYIDGEKKRYGLLPAKASSTMNATTIATTTTLDSSHSNDGDARKTHEHSLGPNPKLLQIKLEKERKEQLDKKMMLQQNNKGSVKQLSEQERWKRLKEMEDDAMMNDTMRIHRHSSSYNKNSSNNNGNESHNMDTNNNNNSGDNISKNIIIKDNGDDEDNNYTGNAKFLQSMRKEVYSTASTMDVSTRIDQNKHYRQRSVDMDSSNGFLKR